MHITLCDDEPIFLHSLQRQLTQWAAQTGVALAIRAFSSAEMLLREWENGLQTDLLLLDIEMRAGISGMELAQRIRARNPNVMIAFVSNYAQYSCQGYEVNAMRFLTKPIENERLCECLNAALAQWKMAQAESIALDDMGSRVLLRREDILYAVADGHYLQIYQTASRAIVRTRMTLPQLLEQAHGLARCHRAYAANLLYVRRVTRDGLLLAEGTHLPVGRKYYLDFCQKFDELYQRAQNGRMDSV